MKLHKLICPNCDGMLDMKIADDTTSVFCPYCAQRFWLDEEKKEYIINKNININKSIHNRYTDDAKILNEMNRDRKDRRDNWMFLGCILLLVAMGIIPTIMINLNEKIATNQGKVNVGDYRDLIGEDYKTVEAHFEAAGFVNIQLIDLDDAGLAMWKNGKVELISVGGDTSFESTDFFEPETKVVISYH